MTAAEILRALVEAMEAAPESIAYLDGNSDKSR